jgi:glycosyltransferase involved in cell wall biosynthesis
MNFIVAQIGARRGYAVPAILEKHGMLERFYTDLCANHGLGQSLSKFHFLGPASLGRLNARRLPDLIAKKATTFGLPNLFHFLRTSTGKRNLEKQYFEWIRFNSELGHTAAARGFGKANALYVMMDEFGPLLTNARASGLKVFSEIYILLSTDRIMNQERKAFPDWEERALDYDALDRQTRPDRPLFNSVDFIICPSEAVREDAITNFQFSRQQTVVVPYGMNPELLNVHPETVRGRVLFAGTADLRKGIHYFAMAAENISRTGKSFEFRVAGHVQPRVTQQPICRHLNFLGRIPRTDMAHEFASADVFVLPSLAEGSAEATYEALACGLPVITTQATGSVVRDGVEGRIVPERDPVALAEAIREVVEDRAKRDRMARAARERARDYTWERYGERLIAALRSLHEETIV